MPKSLEHVVGDPLDQAVIDTACTDCRMYLSRLRLLLEQAEEMEVSELRDDHVYKAAVGCFRALARLGARVHVCKTQGIDATF